MSRERSVSLREIADRKHQRSAPPAGSSSPCSVTYSYDGDGNITTRVAPAPNQNSCSTSVTTSYAYNADDQLLSKTYSDGTRTVNFSYGPSSVTLNSNWPSPTLQYSVGRLTEATTTASGSLQTALVYSYDQMGRVKNLWQCTPYNCGGTPFGMTYDYDLAGDVTGYSGPALAVTYGINNAQQQISMAWGSNVAVSSITYNPAGEISTICGGDGCSDSEETRVYNDRLQPVLMELGTSSSPSADYCLVYNYYKSLGSPSSCAVPAQGTKDNGDVIGKYYLDNVNTGYSHTSTFTYDAVNRLLTAVATGNSSYNLTYSYDEYGNGTCVMNGSTGGLCPQYSYNEATNQISNTGYSYDAAGNLLYDGNDNYTYDAEGRVISATNSGGTQTSMYNALGQRIEDVQPDGSSTMTLTYPRDAFGHKTGIFDQRPSIGWTGWDIWFAQVAGQRIKMGGSTSLLLHSDALGSSTMETDQTGAVDWDGNFYPYGQPWHSGNGEVSFAGLGYPVNEPVLPSATRGYNPTLGRWMVPDPAGMAAAIPSNPQTWNAYAYAGDNPTTNNDPSGEDYYLLGGAACGTDKVECDKQGYLLGADGQREIITDQQVLSGAVGSTVGENGVSSITTSQGTFQAQFFDTSPATYEVSGQPGSDLAAIGANVGIGLWNQAANIGNSFMTNLTVGQYSMNLPYVPTGSGVSADIGAIAPVVGIGLIGPEGEEEIVPSEGQLTQAENVLLTKGRGSVEKGIRSLERLIAEHEEKITTATGPTGSMERELINFKQLLKAYRQVLGR